MPREVKQVGHELRETIRLRADCTEEMPLVVERPRDIVLKQRRSMPLDRRQWRTQLMADRGKQCRLELVQLTLPCDIAQEQATTDSLSVVAMNVEKAELHCAGDVPLAHVEEPIADFTDLRPRDTAAILLGLLGEGGQRSMYRANMHGAQRHIRHAKQRARAGIRVDHNTVGAGEEQPIGHAPHDRGKGLFLRHRLPVKALILPGYLMKSLITALIEYCMLPGKRRVIRERQQQIYLICRERLRLAAMHHKHDTAYSLRDDGNSQNRLEAFGCRDARKLDVAVINHLNWSTLMECPRRRHGHVIGAHMHEVTEALGSPLTDEHS